MWKKCKSATKKPMSKVQALLGEYCHRHPYLWRGFGPSLSGTEPGEEAGRGTRRTRRRIQDSRKEERGRKDED